MNWQGKRVLVTGAGGFIGSHLVERLVELGAHTRGLVHYRAEGAWGWLDHSPCKKDIEVVAGDLMDRDSVVRAMHNRDLVFHLGALIAIPYSYEAPLSFIRTNVEGTLNVLHAVGHYGVERVIHTSTSEVYGTAREIPIGEQHPLQAQSPYAASKIAADKMVEAFHLSFGTPVVTVRPFNTFGPRQSARAVIPTIIVQGLARRRVRLGNVEPTRDLNYVSNTVDGFIQAAATEQVLGRVVNIGSGCEIKIRNLVELIGRLLGQPIEIETDEQRIRPAGSEVERLLADNRLATTLLGWTPAVSLEEGLRLTIDWIKKHQEFYRPELYAI
ncbi:MAG: GDP-mannose 4,6-dehydratase [Nitrospiraceae bacterium]